MASNMDVDEEEIEMPTSSGSKGEKKRFEVKKVSLAANAEVVDSFENIFIPVFVALFA